jgi:hypothetical protein
MVRNIAIHSHGEIPPSSKFPPFETDQTLVWYYDPTEETVSHSLCLEEEYVPKICSDIPTSLLDRPKSRPVVERSGRFPELILTSLFDDERHDIYDCVTRGWYSFPDDIREGGKQYVKLSRVIEYLKTIFGRDLRIHILACGTRFNLSKEHRRETHFLVKSGKRRKTRRRVASRKKTSSRLKQ